MELAEHIFANRAAEAKPEWIADVLGRLVWITNDNGAEICRTLRSWLDSEQLEKVRIALAFDEVFLWETEAEMERVFGSICARFPGLVARCEAIRVSWLDQHIQ